MSSLALHRGRHALSLALGLVLAGCGGATAAESPKARAAPPVLAGDLVFDFGATVQGSSVEHTFTLHCLAVDAVVQEVAPSCNVSVLGVDLARADATTSAPAPPFTVRMGDRVDVRARLRTDRSAGEVEEALSVALGDGTRMALTLRGHVEPLIVFDPPIVDLGFVVAGGSASATCGITSNVLDSFALELEPTHTPDCEMILASASGEPRDSRWVLRIAATARDVTERRMVFPFAARVSEVGPVRAPYVALPEHDVSHRGYAKAEFVDRVYADPGELPLGLIDDPERIDATFRVVCAVDGLTVDRLAPTFALVADPASRVSLEGLHVEILENKANSALCRLRGRVDSRAGSQVTPFRGRVRIDFAQDQVSPLELPIFGLVAAAQARPSER